MPNRNGTGPEGKGPKTGRGLGTCSGNSATNERRDRGFGLGRALGKKFGTKQN